MSNLTQTICTIGPACSSPEILEKLVFSGMSIARFNFSHAKQDEFIVQRDLIKQFATTHGKEVIILLDLQGPRMRVGDLPEEGIELKEGETLTFSTDPSNSKAIYINDLYLHETIQAGHPIFLANGDLQLYVLQVNGNTITAKVIRGGMLYARKGVNVPETHVKTPSITDKDIEDITFAIEQKVDYIALSFVKSGDDMKTLKKMLEGTDIKTIAKIEIKQALTNLDDIIKESDGIMIGRGDLGIELPLEEIPLIQKDIIRKCIELKKPCIVATQMLMSMVNHYRPTRAEVSDVANAVLDGASCCMLSDETAFGKYPVHALEYLVKTIKKVENYHWKLFGYPTLQKSLHLSF